MSVKGNIARKIKAGIYPRYMQMEVDTRGLTKPQLSRIKNLYGYISYGARYRDGKCIRRPKVMKIVPTRWALENAG